jgi:hypothetical protein
VNADHRGQRFERAAIQRERVDEPSGAEKGVGRDQTPPRRVVAVSIECVCGLVREIGVRLTERVPAGGKRRRQRGCRGQLGDGIDEPTIVRGLGGGTQVRLGVARLRRRGTAEQEDRYQSKRTVKPSVRGWIVPAARLLPPLATYFPVSALLLIELFGPVKV